MGLWLGVGAGLCGQGGFVAGARSIGSNDADRRGLGQIGPPEHAHGRAEDGQNRGVS